MVSRMKLLPLLVCLWIDMIVANDPTDSNGMEQIQNGQNILSKASNKSYRMKAQPYQFEELEKEDTHNDNGNSNRRYIVQYKMGAAKTGLGKVASKWNTDLLESTKVLSLDKANADVVMLHSEKQLLQLENDENVEYVEEDHKYYLTEPNSDNHPSRNLLSKTTPYGIDMVKASLVNATNVSNRKVCVIDSGYDIGHSDLQTKYVDGSTTDEDLPWDEDTLGHGTHVVGTIAALGNNEWGVVGVIPNGRLNIHIVRVFGSGSYWAWESDLAAAMYECADANADIINMSLGGSSYSSFFEKTCKDINENRNVLLVASSGNYGYSYYNYPASYDNVMSVAALDSDSERAWFSTYNDKVDIAAPGEDVLSTVPRPFGSYDYKSGTSMAAPHVSGVAALVWSHFPLLSARQIQLVLESSATDLGSTGRDDYYGHGLVNAKAAYDFLANGNTFSPTSSPTGLECVAGKKKFDLKVYPDNYDYTTSWELREACSGDIILQGGEEGKVYCIADKNYVFTIKDSWGYGLCCRYGNGSYELYYDGSLIQSGGEFDDEESFSFGNGTDSCSPSIAPTSKGPTSAPTGLQCEDGQKKFDLKVVPDDDYYDATWTLQKGCNGETVLEGEEEGIVTCLDDLEYDFSISEYNGLCCSYGVGFYEIYYDDMFVKSGGNFWGQESVSFNSSTAQSCSPTMAPTAMECEDGKKKFDLRLTPDNSAYAYQTSWKLLSACSGDVVLEGGAHGNTTCLDDIEYNFTIYDYNGLCCWYGDGSYEVHYDGSLIKAGGSFEDFETVKFGSSTAETCSPTIAPTGYECPQGTQKFVLQMVQDYYPYRISWDLENYESQLTIEFGDGYDDNEVFCLDEKSNYAFEIRNSYGYGLCCYYGNGQYNIYYNDNLLRRGTSFGYSDVTVFGFFEETLTLGLVGASSKINDSNREAFLFQTRRFISNYFNSESQIEVDSVSVSVVQSVMMPSVNMGVQSGRRFLEEERVGRSLNYYGKGLMVSLTISAQMLSLDPDYYGVNYHDDNGGNYDDESGLSNSLENAFLRLFENNWNTYEDMILPVMTSDGIGNGNGYGTDGTLLIVFIVGSAILSIILLLLAVMLIKMRKEINTFKQVSPNTNGSKDDETWEDNAVTTKAVPVNEEEKVDEGDTENASTKTYDLGKWLPVPHKDNKDKSAEF